MNAYKCSVFPKLQGEQCFSILGIEPLAKVTSRKTLVHCLIAIWAPREGHGSEFVFVFHVSFLAFVWPKQLYRLSLWFLIQMGLSG